MPMTLWVHLEAGDVSWGLPWELVPETAVPTLVVGRAPVSTSLLSVPTLGARVVLVPFAAALVGPHTPVTTDKSCTFPRAAGVDPQLDA